MSAAHTSSPALVLRGVTVPGRLHELDLEVAPGRLLGLIGPNGAGKSTLLAAAAGVLSPAAGTVRWGGVAPERLAPTERGRLTAWAPQEARFEFGFSVRSVVAQGRYAHGDDGARVEAALDRFALNDLADRPVNRLSGGERHRVLLARAWTTGARLHLWDEPLAALDPRHALQTLAVLRGLAEEGAAVVFSLHDLGLASRLDEVAVVHAGRLRACGAPSLVLDPPLLREVFGVAARTEPAMSFYI